MKTKKLPNTVHGLTTEAQALVDKLITVINHHVIECTIGDAEIALATAWVAKQYKDSIR